METYSSNDGNERSGEDEGDDDAPPWEAALRSVRAADGDGDRGTEDACVPVPGHFLVDLHLVVVGIVGIGRPRIADEAVYSLAVPEEEMCDGS